MLTEKQKVSQRKWVAKNRKKVNATRRQWVANSRAAVLLRLGAVCIRCGYLDSRALQIDHIFGGGNKELKAMGETKYYAYLNHLSLEELKARYQILCANCNWIKRSENGENCQRKD